MSVKVILFTTAMVIAYAGILKMWCQMRFLKGDFYSTWNGSICDLAKQDGHRLYYLLDNVNFIK